MTTTGYFEDALAFVLQNEGGFVDNPNDAGGRTNFGITQRTYSGWLYARKMSNSDVKDMSVDIAGLVYSQLYWIPYGFAGVTRRTPAMAMFDAAVLFGADVSVFRAQAALRICGAADLVIDGRLGNETCRAIQCFSPSNFLRVFRDNVEKRIADICAARPQNEVFRSGWLNRINRYPNLV